MDRRDFVKTVSAGAIGAGTTFSGARAQPLSPRRMAPSDQINVGVIGVGSRGKYMMSQMLKVSGVRFTALCDIYEPRLDQGRRLTGGTPVAYKDYREMLEKEQDLDAVLIATPLHLHAEHMVASLNEGLHVYGEKSMGFTVDHCNQIVRAARRSGKHFQVGHQYRYAPWYRQTVEGVLAGEIGEVTHIFGYWHRNYNWRRPVPEPGLERQINWRLYKDYSGGLLAELGSHHLDVANWIFGETPSSVLGNGGINFYPDGRETYDNVQAIFNYPSGGKFIFSSLIGNHKVGFQIWIYGTGGSVQLTLEDGYYFFEPARPNSAVPEAMVEEGANTSASLSTHGDMPYRGEGRLIEVPPEQQGDPNFLCVDAFFTCLREDKRPFADEAIGWGSAVPVALGNKAIYEEDHIHFADIVTPLSAL